VDRRGKYGICYVETETNGKANFATPNMEKDYKIYADANTVAISGVLMQSGENEDDHVIAYTSRKLTPAEKRYPIFELELLSIVHALKIFHQYINTFI